MTLHGVCLHPLTTHADDRGTFTEIFRQEWGLGVEPLQWNAVRTEARVLRGVHVHVAHADLLTVLAGRATIGLRDVRSGSPTSGAATTVELRGDAMQAIVIPPGVAHGFLFHEPSLHVYSVTEYWAPEDEMGCHWADPALGIAWPFEPERVSERDEAAGSLAELEAQLALHQAAFAV
ncbi:MAG TPA: dTDP-4-dehydrorhamnose 3,5-epimerase [Solirubrobacteraceae bacterium]|nr:dTDP-4-dehydrorhamnose 3,5-epimerase [Solirubrobacteraceae bacterium]